MNTGNTTRHDLHVSSVKYVQQYEQCPEFSAIGVVPNGVKGQAGCNGVMQTKNDASLHGSRELEVRYARAEKIGIPYLFMFAKLPRCVNECFTRICDEDSFQTPMLSRGLDGGHVPISILVISEQRYYCEW